MCRKVGRVLTDVTAGLLTQSPLRLRLGERRCVWSLTGSSKRDSSEQRIGGDRTSSCIQGSYIRSMLQSLRPLSNFNQQSKQKQLSSTHREMKLPIALIGHAVAHPGVMQCSCSTCPQIFAWRDFGVVHCTQRVRGFTLMQPNTM